MTTKYHGLPDIDTAADVFETPDEPEDVLRPAETGLEADEGLVKGHVEGLDVTGLPARKKVERVFGRGTRRPDPSNPSFRPRLPPLSRHRSSSSSDSDEEVPTPRETAAARLRRLKAELAEVEAELGSTSHAGPSSAGPQGGAEASSSRVVPKRKSVLEPRKPIDAFSELSSLKQRLEQVDSASSGSGVPCRDASRSEWKERLERLQSQDPSRTSRMHAEDSAGERVAQSSSLGDIDKRLAVLEDTLGPIGDGQDQSSPIMPMLKRHHHLLTLLSQPRQLDAISRRIKLLLVDLDRATAASRRGAKGQAQPEAGADLNLTEGEYDSLQSLFAILPRLDPLLPIVSPLLARLRSLSELHAQASDVVDSLRRLQADDKRSTEEAKELSEVVAKIQSGLDEATGAIAKNWAGVEDRFRSLDERLRVLEV
ncbi:hypothetical protein IAU60_002610 [Kwoniella sp. DSM 27419]